MSSLSTQAQPSLTVRHHQEKRPSDLELSVRIRYNEARKMAFGTDPTLLREDMKMKAARRKILRRIVIVAVVVLAVAAVVGYVGGDYLLIRGFVFFGVRDAQRNRVSLLYETDHQALLNTCRELSAMVSKGELKPGEYYLHGSERHPAASRFPKPILELAPTYVYIDENDCRRVMVEMHGGFDHFGVEAYAEDYKKPSYFEYRDKELIPGLWYYDEGYRENPEYEKVIEALRPGGK